MMMDFTKAIFMLVYIGKSMLIKGTWCEFEPKVSSFFFNLRFDKTEKKSFPGLSIEKIIHFTICNKSENICTINF